MGLSLRPETPVDADAIARDAAAPAVAAQDIANLFDVGFAVDQDHPAERNIVTRGDRPAKIALPLGRIAFDIIGGLGERLVRFTLDTLGDPQVRDDLISMARSGASAAALTKSLQDYLDTTVIDRVVSAVGVPDARMRVALISSYLIGVAAGRYVMRIEPLASANEEYVVRLVAPTIQALLDPRTSLPKPTGAAS